MKRWIVPAVVIVGLAGCARENAEETPQAADAAVAEPPATATVSPNTAPAGQPAGLAAEGTLLDPNQASRDQLLSLPNVTEPVADAIIAGRPYGDMVAVNRVVANHLDEEQRKAVYGRLWKPLDLNTATSEEILLIPGVGRRMQHEFEEYRPYRGIEQFRREIGKYVDEQEVARLEQYVTIR